MPRPVRPPPCVCVAFDWSRPFAREVLAGILDHAKARRWALTRSTPADGAIFDYGDAAIYDIPTVGLWQANTVDVHDDKAAAARMAVDHFRERGFRNFARTATHVDLNAFEAAVRDAGFPPPHVIVDKTKLRDLPRPLAVFAGSGAGAIAVRGQAHDGGLRVPEDVAILCTGNDLAMCEIGSVPLSSIDVGYRQIGRRAAERLDRLMRGRPVGWPESVPPIGIVPRASTDTLAIDDLDVVAAIRFIRENAAWPLRVGDVVRAVDLDRRTLERRFQKYLGRSPAEVLRRARVERAAGLLRSTTLPMTDIAKASGFRLPQHLAAAFKAIHGQTPSDYRASIVVRSDDTVPSPGIAGRGLGRGLRA